MSGARDTGPIMAGTGPLAGPQRSGIIVSNITPRVELPSVAPFFDELASAGRGLQGVIDKHLVERAADRGAKEGADAAKRQAAGEDVSKVRAPLTITEAGEARKRAFVQGYRADIRTTVDERLGKFAIDHPYDPEAFRAASELVVSGFIQGAPAEHAVELESYAKAKATDLFLQISGRRQERDTVAAKGAIVARRGILKTAIEDAITTDGSGLAALEQPTIKARMAEYVELSHSLAANPAFGISEEEASAELANDFASIKAAAIAAHTVGTYRREGYDAALAEIQGMQRPRAMVSPGAGPAPVGMVEAGNIDLNSRPTVHNADGTVSTVRSITVESDGRAYLLPTVSDDGRILSDDDAVHAWRASGRHLGVFDSEKSADAYAQTLHLDQAAQAGDGLALAPHERELAVQRAKEAVTREHAVDLERTNAARSTRAQLEADMRRSIEDDVASVSLTGKATGLTADQVEAALGPSGLTEWYAKRAEAQDDFNHFGDLSRLTPDQAAARIAQVQARRGQALPDTIANADDLQALVKAMSLVETPGRSNVVSADPDGPGPAGGGAYGDMQLLPATAKRMAAKLGLAYDQGRLLSDDAYNRQLGTAYLSELLTRYHGDAFLAVTGYHAGEGNVDKWLAAYGDPRQIGREAWLAKVRVGNPRSADYPTKVAAAMGGGKAWEAWEKASQLRDSDPAAAVAGDFAVQSAQAKWKADVEAGRTTTGSGAAMASAFLDAQDRAGISTGKRQPLPNTMLERYAADARNYARTGDWQGYLAWSQRVVAQFNDPISGNGHGDAVLQATLERAYVSGFAARASANLVTKAGAGKPTTAADTAQAHAAARTETQARAATGGLPARIVPAAAVADLKADPSPGAQAEFDAVFGKGAASRALGGGR